MGHEVRHIAIPQYEGLTIADMAGFVSQHPEVNDYLPDGKEVLKIPKAWIGCVINTVLGETFSKWVKDQVEKRNAQLVVEKGLAIEMDPEVAEVFKASTKTSGKCPSSLSAHPLSSSQCCTAPASTCSRRTRNDDAPRQRSRSRRRPPWPRRT